MVGRFYSTVKQLFRALSVVFIARVFIASVYFTIYIIPF